MKNQIVKLKSGFGYWDITNYPIGGCFKRASDELTITIKKELDRRYNRGCSHSGLTTDNRRVAFNIEHTWDTCQVCGKKAKTEFCQVDESSVYSGIYKCEDC